MDESIDCPSCGCNDSDVVRSSDSSARMWKGNAVVGEVQRRRVTRRCNHCDHRWTSTTQKLLAAPSDD